MEPLAPLPLLIGSVINSEKDPLKIGWNSLWYDVMIAVNAMTPHETNPTNFFLRLRAARVHSIDFISSDQGMRSL